MKNSKNFLIKTYGEVTSLEEVLSHVNEGWHPLVTKLVEDLFKAGWNGDLHQIKEKFGGLRFYIGEGSDHVYALIMKAETESLTICEICGKPGRTSGWGTHWIKTLCEEHGEKYNKRELF